MNIISRTKYFRAIFLTSTFLCVAGIQSSVHVELTRNFLEELVGSVGNGSRITRDNITSFLEKHHLAWQSNDTVSQCLKNVTGTIQVDWTCIQKKCLSPDDVYQLSGLDHGEDGDQLSALSAILLHQLESPACQDRPIEPEADHHGNRTHSPPSSAAAWGFGILSATLINLCSLTGVIALPFIHGTVYKGMLIYMVALAVGTLCGSSILFLIPEALELTEQLMNEHNYIWKCLTVVMAVYIFFLIERVLKIITTRREKKKIMKENLRKRVHRDSAMSYSSFHKAKDIPEYRKTNNISDKLPCFNNGSSSSITEEGGSLSGDEQDQEQDQETTATQNGLVVTSETQDTISTATRKPLVPKHHHHHHVAPVAWMIIFGDGLHNFIDGVSIGAAFTESVLAGVSVSIAILCEEFPHELGDFAVLLNAGMRMKKAVLYNFLSATMCYLGLIVGILLGENTSTHTWVFAFAGGMFLYISLVDMMPEMNSAAEDEENKQAVGSRIIFALQNFGLLTGLALMTIMAIYGGALEDSITGGR